MNAKANDYYTEITIFSNDPDTPEFIVPITMIVNSTGNNDDLIDANTIQENLPQIHQSSREFFQ